MLTSAQIRKLRTAPLTGRNKVALAMTLADLTQVEVAGRLGKAQSHVSDVCRGEYIDLPLETSRAWAHLFGVQVEDLFPAPVASMKVPA